MNKRYKLIASILCILLFIVFICFYNKQINSKESITGTYDYQFKDHVVFYPQHQDDEVLWSGSAIIEAIKQCGKDNVYVVLVSDGSGVNIFKNKEFNNLSRKEKQQIRDIEFKDSLNNLGVKEENIIILSDIDKDKGSHFELMKEVAINFENKFKDVTHIAHTYKYDNHPMHRKNGKVIHKLYLKNQIKESLYFIKPKYADKIPAEQRILYIAQDGDSYNKIKNACEQYKLIDKGNKRYGIGYTSSHNYFDNLLKDPYLTSILYKPN